MGITERRKYPRWRANLPVRYRLLGESGMYRGSLSKDIGTGGVRVVTDRFLPKDKALNVEISLGKAKRRFLAKGRIAWTEFVRYRDDAFASGIEFTEMNEKDKRDLAAYVDYYLMIGG